MASQLDLQTVDRYLGIIASITYLHVGSFPNSLPLYPYTQSTKVVPKVKLLAGICTCMMYAGLF